MVMSAVISLEKQQIFKSILLKYKHLIAHETLHGVHKFYLSTTTLSSNTTLVDDDVNDED